MKTQEHQGKPEHREGMSGRAVETEWDRIIDKEEQGARTPTEHRGDPDPADHGNAVDHAHPAMSSPIRINSILPNQAPPGQSVIIQGDGLGATNKVLFDGQETSFDIDGQVLVLQVPVPDGTGTVEVTVKGVDGESDVVSFTIT
jgi:hypothetical protein